MGSTTSKWFKWAAKLLPFWMAAVYMDPVFAQTTNNGTNTGNINAICVLANYYKQIIGGVALIAGIVWFVGYVNKRESLSDLAQTVIIGCIVVGALSYLIGMTGLQMPAGC
jgi:hypothetical protein